MNHKLLSTLALVVLVVVAFGTSPAGAGSAAGPYYATPSWDQQLPASTRFIVLTNWNSVAVLDRETGLVWEKAPSGTPDGWFDAVNACTQLNLGKRLGWRLPTIQELASLVDGDPANTSSPRLPPGHPFVGVQGASYWSATLYFGDSNTARVVNFFDGSMDSDGRQISGNEEYFWCVRGGQGVDSQ